MLHPCLLDLDPVDREAAASDVLDLELVPDPLHLELGAGDARRGQRGRWSGAIGRRRKKRKVLGPRPSTAEPRSGAGATSPMRPGCSRFQAMNWHGTRALARLAAFSRDDSVWSTVCVDSYTVPPVPIVPLARGSGSPGSLYCR